MPSSKHIISRLLTLLLLLLLGYISAHTVNGSPGDLGNISEYSKTLTGGTSVVRKYRLNSLCSNRDVQMGTRKKQGRRRGGGGGGGGGSAGDQGKLRVRARKKTVNARGRRGSKYTVLIFKSQAQGGVVQVYGEHAQMYLCFNRRGRLIIRHDVTNDGRCLFTEHLEDNYTMLQSKANTLWYVGFNKRGRRMKGYRSQDSRRRRCYQFNKEDIESTRRHKQRVGPFSRVRSNNWFRRSMRKRPAVVRDVVKR